ncbi:MAG TPA: putative porin [Xanthobacteraceae bacterium]|nr:putative porin [Xanthobacteraceae bacterium]
MACDRTGRRELARFAAAALCGVMLAFPAMAQQDGGSSNAATNTNTGASTSTGANANAGTNTKASSDATPGTNAKAARPTVSHTAPPSPNANVNLINILMQQGVLTEEQGAALIKQAEDEAYVARQAVHDAAAKADDADKTAKDAADATSPPGTKHVVYVPEVVKKELRDEIKGEVMTKAQKEGWAAPGKFPDWASRIHFYGDVRVRSEWDFFPKGNDPQAAVNYNAINTGSPYDTSLSNPVLWPTYDTDQDRYRARLRARLGMDADLSDGFWAGLKIGTGDGNAPVTFNQTLGGSGGNFSNYAIWLDRAYIKYARWTDFVVDIGRFDNPFFTPTDLVYNRDLGFDGFAVQATPEVRPGFVPFVVAGAFPIYDTDFNVGSLQTVKLPSHDKWMFGGQIGTIYNLVPEVEQKFGIALYDFTNVQGELSSPCAVSLTTDVCDTDLTRPSFAQRGNTYMALRDILPEAANGFGTLDQFQYFGLASKFRPLVFSGQIDFTHFNPYHVILDGDFVWNTAFNRADVAAKAAANPLPAGAAGASSSSNSPFVGGDLGWLARMTVGNRELKQLGDWNVHVGYKWLESDAVIDAFTDSDFGLGGTNLKGYFFGANLAVSANVWLSARWMSANQVAGPPYAVDVAQVDLNAKF